MTRYKCHAKRKRKHTLCRAFFIAEKSLSSGACRRVLLFVVFFFQAEDGIRDLTVTGVQTCALPILVIVVPRLGEAVAPDGSLAAAERERLRAYVRGRVANRPTELPDVVAAESVRSEERRVGKEGRSRWSPYH